MARLQLIDSSLHGMTDYTVGSFLLTAFPKVAGIEGTDSARQIRIAAGIHAGYSAVTKYPLGLVKLLPYQAHLALDALGAVALAATPFVTGQFTKGRKHWLPHVGLALFEFASLAMTDPTGRGAWHGDTEAVREANMENPARKIRDPQRAVVPGSARDGATAAAS